MTSTERESQDVSQHQSVATRDGGGWPSISFRAMGTTCMIAVEPQVAADSLLAVARMEVERLEQTFSRFREDSELARLNRAQGGVAGRELATVIETALVLAHRTGWLFDPTMLSEIESAGYDRDFSKLEAARDIGGRERGREVVKLSAAARHARAVTLSGRKLSLQPGIGIDLGGIAKGWSAQRVAEMAGEGGGALVDLGGDCFVTPPGPAAGRWPIGVDHGQGELCMLLIDQGAICTSTVLKRRWHAGSRDWHHILDPSMRIPTELDLNSITVVDDSGARAEAWTKAGLVGGSRRGLNLLEVLGADAIATGATGATYVVGEALTGVTETATVRVRVGPPPDCRSNTNSIMPEPEFAP